MVPLLTGMRGIEVICYFRNLAISFLPQVCYFYKEKQSHLLKLLQQHSLMCQFIMITASVWDLLLTRRH